MDTLVYAAPYVTAYSILLFNIIGHFGNISIIMAVKKTKVLQSTNGIMLAIMAAEQSLCLGFELINAYYSFKGGNVLRESCFLVMAPYIFLTVLQCWMFLMISFDMLLGIMFPQLHQNNQIKLIYILSLNAAPVICGIALLCKAWIEMDSEVIFLCNPPLAMPPHVSRVWSGGLTWASIITLIFFISVYALVYERDKAKKRVGSLNGTSAEKKAMKTLTVLVTMFVTFRLLCTSSVFLVKFFNFSETVVDLVGTYAVVLALVSYSQNYYVCYARSKLYRKAFLLQISSYSPKLAHHLDRKEKLLQPKTACVKATTS